MMKNNAKGKELSAFSEKDFMKSMDSWIKKINSDISRLVDIPDEVQENICNIEHNYEMMKIIKAELKELREEVKIIKATQLFMMESRLNEKGKNK